MVKKLKQKLRFVSSRKKKEESWFIENRSIFLKALIAYCNGKSVPIRSFSSSQILQATTNFDFRCVVTRLTRLSDDVWYKGIIEDERYLIRRFFVVSRVKKVYNDIVLSARMSNHTNFLKLVGCCLEFSFPVVVFEYAEDAVLNEDGRIMLNGEEHVLPWSVRLKIAKEVAIAVTYLHTAFPKIIIHRDIVPTNIFLDKNRTAKLTDFALSITLPEGKSRMQVGIAGTRGYLDPLYYSTGFVTEYTDVYSFGVCLFDFLTGKSALSFYTPNPNGTRCDPQAIIKYVKRLYENKKLEEVIDPVMAKDITSGENLQMEACVVLALRCCCGEREEDRPKMIQAAKELKRIQQMGQSVDTTSATI